MDIILAGTGNTDGFDQLIVGVFLFWTLLSIILYSVSKIRKMREEARHPEEDDIELAESEHRIFGHPDSVHPTT